MIRFANVYKAYPNGALALKDVTFHVSKGEFVFLTGHSGAGKSTIMKLLFAEQQPTSGEVIVNGTSLAQVRDHGGKQRRCALGHVAIVFDEQNTHDLGCSALSGYAPLNHLVPRGKLRIDHRVYDERTINRHIVQCSGRPTRPDGILCDEVQQDIGINQRQSSPRVIAIISSVLSPGPAWPRNFRNRFGGRFSSARSRTISPPAPARISTITFLSSLGSRSTIARRISSSPRCRRCSTVSPPEPAGEDGAQVVSEDGSLRMSLQGPESCLHLFKGSELLWI